MSSQKTNKIFIFSKGLVHGFCQKIEILNVLFLCKMDQEKVFCEFSERKEAFLDQKKSTQKTTKIFIFLKGLVDGFCQKMEIF